MPEAVRYLNAKATLLLALHAEGRPALVLPNAWDPASAALIAEAGARAIATTSGGVAWSRGRPDGEGLSRAEMAEAVTRIVAAVDVPVTADVEAGYGATPRDVAATIRAMLDAGAVGVNLEDSRAPGGPLFTAGDQAERIGGARAAAVDAGVPDVVINARTDVFLFRVGAPETRFDAVLARAEAFAAAGADCLFVPGLLDLDVLRALVAAAGLPVNAMAVPGGPSIGEIAATGVRRISVGTAISEAAYAVARRAARELLSLGGYGSLADAVPYGELNALLDRRPTAP